MLCHLHGYTTYCVDRSFKCVLYFHLNLFKVNTIWYIDVEIRWRSYHVWKSAFIKKYLEIFKHLTSDKPERSRKDEICTRHFVGVDVSVQWISQMYFSYKPRFKMDNFGLYCTWYCLFCSWWKVSIIFTINQRNTICICSHNVRRANRSYTS